MLPAVLVRPISPSRKGGSVEGKTIIVDTTEPEPDPFEGPGPTRDKRPHEQTPGSPSKDLDDDIH
jgi:hypothetical protein